MNEHPELKRVTRIETKEGPATMRPRRQRAGTPPKDPPTGGGDGGGGGGNPIRGHRTRFEVAVEFVFDEHGPNCAYTLRARRLQTHPRAPGLVQMTHEFEPMCTYKRNRLELFDFLIEHLEGVLGACGDVDFGDDDEKEEGG